MEKNDYLTPKEVVLYNIGNLIPSFKGHLTRLLKRLKQKGSSETLDKKWNHL